MYILQIINGKINNKNVIKLLKDGEYELKRYIKGRTIDQNKYYWGLLSIIADETGTDSNDIHEKMRMKFLYVPEDGKQLAYCKSTSKLNTKEFSDYIENIKLFMLDFNIILPNADEFKKYLNDKNELNDLG